MIGALFGRDAEQQAKGVGKVGESAPVAPRHVKEPPASLQSSALRALANRADYHRNSVIDRDIADLYADYITGSPVAEGGEGVQLPSPPSVLWGLPSVLC